MLGFIKQFNSVLPRPKVLIVIYGKGARTLLQGPIKEFLSQTWNDKFLHLTLIFVQHEPKSRPVYIYYQPFAVKCYEKELKHNSTLFPDKLKDMNGYGFTISDPFHQHENIVAFEESQRYKKHFLLLMNPGHYIFIKGIFCKVHNCTAVLVNYSPTNESNILYSGFMSMTVQTDNI